MPEDYSAGRREEIPAGTGAMIGEIKALKDGDRAVLIVLEAAPDHTNRYAVYSYGCDNDEDLPAILGVMAAGQAYITSIIVDNFQQNEEADGEPAEGTPAESEG